MPSLASDQFRQAFMMAAGCLAISVTISALEYVALFREFQRGGAFCWRFIEYELHGTGNPLSSAVDTLLRGRAMTCVLAFRALCGGGLLLICFLTPQDLGISILVLAGVLGSGVLLHYRCTFGLEGGDFMSTIVAAGLLIAALPQSSGAWRIIGLGFIAAESSLCYFSSGVAKVLSPSWRSGLALYGIVRTGTFGHRAVALQLRNRRSLNLVLCWTVILFELAFPLVLLVPSRVMILVLVAGAAFHITNAFVMGLNTFCWSFLATYPALWYCHTYISDSMVRLAYMSDLTALVLLTVRAF